MQIEVNLALTVVTAILVLLVGRAIIARVSFLHAYSIPEPVVGGLVAALLITIGRIATDAQITFDMRLQTPLLLTFFTTLGLGSDIRTLARGGKKLLILLVAVVIALLLQNALGVAIATGMDLNPLMGLLGGSATMAGGHATGAVYGKLFGEVNNLQGAVEVAMACATFGLILGGVLGGPVAQWLIRRHTLRPGSPVGESTMPGVVYSAERRALSPESLLETVLILMACLGIGTLLASYVKIPGIVLPSFVWCLLTGIFLRNVLELSGLYQLDRPTIELIGTVSLSLFLAMALMALRLWELVSLALPILVILGAQAATMAVFAAVITFRLMGRDYDAAVIAAGHCGFQLGATPTAIANMQAVTDKYGYSAVAFLLVPIVGAFLIDLCNALVIQGYLALPLFGF